MKTHHVLIKRIFFTNLIKNNKISAEEDNRREGTERKPPKVFENALDRFR